MMGLEEHLLGMFRGDFEFHEDAAPSHLGRSATPAALPPSAPIAVPADPVAQPASWAPDAEQELRKIPFFVRAKARRNTEAYAMSRALPLITLETLYDAKAHFSK